MRISGRFIFAAVWTAMAATAVLAEENAYVEPGSLRLSHELSLEGLLHRTLGGYRVTNEGINKTYAKTGNGTGPARAEFGQSFLTEAAARFSPGLFARVLFELQGDYADRFWRPVNENHRIDLQGRHAPVRLTARNATVLGKVLVHAIDLAENCLFSAPVCVARRQIGCVRFSYLAPGSKPPRTFRLIAITHVAAVKVAASTRSRAVRIATAASSSTAWGAPVPSMVQRPPDTSTQIAP